MREVRAIGPGVSEGVVVGKITGMLLGSSSQPLVPLEGRERSLSLEELPCIVPSSLPLVGLVDYLSVDGQLAVVDELGKLLVDEGNEVVGELTCQVHVLEHVLLSSHLLLLSLIKYRNPTKGIYCAQPERPFSTLNPNVTTGIIV